MTKRKRQSVFGNRWGAFLMLGIFGLLFLLMFVRIALIQATGSAEGRNLAATVAEKHTKQESLTATRGKILDHNGSVIAEDEQRYKVYAIITPKISEGLKENYHVVDVDKTARVLAKYIDLSQSEIRKIIVKAQKEDKYQVEFNKAGRNLPNSVKKQIEAEKLPGINFETQLVRFYPNGIFASNLVGIVKEEEVRDKETQLFTRKVSGEMGIERTYNDELSGTNGKLEYQSDFWGRLLPMKDETIVPAKDGQDIYLTLDKTIQSFLEDSMSQVQKKYKPESMMAVVADPKTGRILAMSQRPTFNLKTREGLENSWANYLTEQTIEPGSTMKTFTLATAIEQGKWEPNATFQSGQYKVYDATIRDSNQQGWGRITYLEGIQRSSNVGMANLLKQIGPETFMDSLKTFGFGTKTGIDLPGEVAGKLLNQYPINVVTTSYGQGSTVTPIQMIQAYSAIANDGKMMQPYVIDKIVDPNTGKTIEQHEPTVKGQPISAETAKEVRDTLATTVTAEHGTARKFASEDYEVTGKTGTAQIPKAGGGYSWGKNQFLYSFLGSAPADDPQLVMYIAVQKPNLGEKYVGSDPTSEVFNSVMDRSLKYLNVAPEQVERADEVEVSNYVELGVDDAKQKLAAQKLQPVIIGEGGKQVAAQYPEKDETVLEGAHLFLKTDSDTIQLPSFKGWSLRDVLTYQSLSGQQFTIKGEGFVTKQSLPAGTTLDKNSKLTITLQQPKEPTTPKK
ncbi:penicillin-binding protein [Kurthia huakuii]|uniref:penicillin-binding protein n=1 Tax=Kurthia huakuii TaxID=1421019 RepID=UPI00049857B0|nr:penicillin-binding protein [Kurthia huakuii]MBM7698412.1 penicillin-binding protein 2B [Kurthia huakuii]